MNIITPWIVPEIPEELKNIFLKHGEKTTVKKGYILHNINREPENLFYVLNGCVAHEVINDLLDKPIAMSLLPPGRMTGFINFFTRIRMPSRAETLEKSELMSLPYTALNRQVNTNAGLLKDMAAYQELCNKSDLYGMLLIMTHPVEERLKMLFTCILLTTGYGFVPCTLDTLVEIPLRITRLSISRIIYASSVSLDRILAEWHREGVLIRQEKYYRILPRKLLNAYEWLCGRS